MPRFNIQPRARGGNDKTAQLQQMQENDLRQQQIDTQAGAVAGTQQLQQQAGMLDMLSKLYGISQQEEMAPLQMGQVKAQTALAQSGADKNSAMLPYEQGQANSAIKASDAQANYYGRELANPEDKTMAGLYAAGGINKDEFLGNKNVGELRAGYQQKKTAETKNRFAGIEQQARQGPISPDDMTSIMQQYGPENLEYLKTLAPQKGGVPYQPLPPGYESGTPTSMLEAMVPPRPNRRAPIMKVY